MDSYRPGPPPADEGNADGNNEEYRNQQRARDYDRRDLTRDYDRRQERDRDYDHHRRRGPRHDSYHQDYARGDQYRDLDRGERGSGGRYESGARMNYDDDYEGQRVPTRGRYNHSDMMRFGTQHNGPPNTGEKDMTPTDEPNRYLLITGLKASVTEELLAKGVEKLYCGADEYDTGAAPFSLRAVMIVRERGSNHNMGYGFAEFHTVADAKAAWVKSRKLDQQCTVSSQRFFTGFPHGGVFPPASVVGHYGPTEKEFTFINPSTGRPHKYYDERYYTRPHIVNEKEPVKAVDFKTGEKGGLAGSSAGTKRGIDVTGAQPSNKPKKVKKDPEPAPIAELQKWQTKQAELREEINPTPDTASTQQPVSDQQTYAVDTPEHQRCYLCNTKFPTSDKLMLHLRKSDTHAAFLQDDDRKTKALARLEKNSIDSIAGTVKMPTAEPTTTAEQQNPAWRDRAAERRQDTSANPPAATTSQEPQKVKMSLKAAPAAKNAAVPADSLSKGRAMLAKLGYDEGSGLGEDGQGRTAPLEQDFYAAGVGLGHEGSRRGDAVEIAAERTRGGGAGFLEATRENARRRFEGM